MQNKINISSFKDLMKNQGNGQVSYAKALIFAEIGHQIINYAMNSRDIHDFDNNMKIIEKRLQAALGDDFNPKYTITNIASCIIYAQTKDNFDLHQGYGHGSNINQFGDEETSMLAVRNITYFFTKNITKKGSLIGTLIDPKTKDGYARISSHNTWKSTTITLPKDIKELDIGIDIKPDIKKGSIPLPFKNMRHALFIPGIDKSGIVKMLMKTEHHGLRKPVEIGKHLRNYLAKKFHHKEVQGLEMRSERSLQTCSSILNTIHQTIPDCLETSPFRSCMKELETFLENREISTNLDAVVNKLEAKRNEIMDLVEKNYNADNADDAIEFCESLDYKIRELIAINDPKTQKHHDRAAHLLYENREDSPVTSPYASSRIHFEELKRGISSSSETSEESVPSPASKSNR